MEQDLDVSELITEADRLPAVAAAAMEKLRPAVTKGALNIKNQHQAEARRSRHFKFAGTINFEQKHGATFAEAEIGPRKVGAGRLAHFAYFGAPNGGGGTVADPEDALKAEQPRFEQAVTDIVAEMFE